MDEQFWKSLDRSAGKNSCWLWLLRTDKDGYGKVSRKRLSQKTWRSHRYSYFLTYGQIPTGKKIIQICKNRLCCNPVHLILSIGKYINSSEDFWSFVAKKEDNDCWNWQLSPDKDGYGIFSINGKNWKAHRYAYFTTYGEITEGLLVCHKCDNPACVNPKHLFLGTSKINLLDMVEKGRSRSCLTVNDVHFIRVNTENLSRKQLAEQFNVTETTISRVINKTRWSSI